jgi:hypothetical protein
MSLDVSLVINTNQERLLSIDGTEEVEQTVTTTGTGVYFRRDGQNVELTLEECKEKWPDREWEVQTRQTTTVYDANITHNLGTMADAAGIYTCMWRPEELGITLAEQLIEPLSKGLALLKSDPERFEKYNASNGWGLYKNFVPFVEQYLEACKEYPKAIIEISR